MGTTTHDVRSWNRVTPTGAVAALPVVHPTAG
jgi:hypothetical protein